MTELAMTKNYFFYVWRAHTHIKAGQGERGWCSVSVKRPLLSKSPCLNLSPLQGNESAFESYFFPICLCLSRLSTAEYQSPAAPWHYSWRSEPGSLSGGIRNYWRTIQNKEHLSHDLRELKAWVVVVVFFIFPPLPRPLFLFKPGVISWVQFNIWEEGWIWIFIILW